MGAKDIVKFQFKKGQSGNPNGRPVGTSMKEYARKYLACMSDDERTEFMNSLDPEIVWKMAEGNPALDENVKLLGDKKNPVRVVILEEMDETVQETTASD